LVCATSSGSSDPGRPCDAGAPFWAARRSVRVRSRPGAFVPHPAVTFEMGGGPRTAFRWACSIARRSRSSESAYGTETDFGARNAISTQPSVRWLATAPARFLLGELGAGKAVGTFARLIARYGLRNVPTHVEIIAELPACHAGAATNRRPDSGTTTTACGISHIQPLIPQVHMPCCGAGGNRWKSRSLREPGGEAVRPFYCATRPNESPPEAAARATRPSRRRPICPYPSGSRRVGRAKDRLPV
jgi:hypothetical protein